MQPLRNFPNSMHAPLQKCVTKRPGIPSQLLFTMLVAHILFVAYDSTAALNH